MAAVDRWLLWGGVYTFMSRTYNINNGFQSDLIACLKCIDSFQSVISLEHFQSCNKSLFNQDSGHKTVDHTGKISNFGLFLLFLT